MIDLTMFRAVPREGGEMSEHTPTPWELRNNSYGHPHDFSGSDGTQIGGCYVRGGPWTATGFENKEAQQCDAANAALIVRAVNSHAALRAALEEITRRTKVYIDRLSDYGGQDDRTVSALGELCNAHNEARRALTEA